MKIPWDHREEDKFVAWALQNRTADLENLQKFHNSMYGLATSAVDRARSGAEVVQKSAAAIATLYSGVLALVFSVTSNPLPLRGLLTPIFLGLAVVLSTVYLAYLRPDHGFSTGKPAVGPEPKSLQRLNTFLSVTSRITNRRAGFLRASVISLGFGLACIVAPFVSFSPNANGVSALPSSPSWPTPSPHATAEAYKILFQAQVKEVAEARVKATSHGGLTADLITLAAGLVIGVAAVTLLPRMHRN